MIKGNAIYANSIPQILIPLTSPLPFAMLTAFESSLKANFLAVFLLLNNQKKGGSKRYTALKPRAKRNKSTSFNAMLQWRL